MAAIIFRPTCSKCNRILVGKVIDQHSTLDMTLYADNTVLIPVEYYIEPQFCPYCNEAFDAIIIPTKLPIDDRYLSDQGRICHDR